MEASMNDTNQATQATPDPPSIPSTLERGPPGEEDPAAMTIEFLRARLLSERSVSKAARERSRQLAKKVTELEDHLEAEIELRKKLEADRLRIFMKCRAELGDHYGDLSSSSLGEGLSRDEGVSHSPHRREGEHDTDENGNILANTSDQGGEGLSHSRLKQLDRSDSSPQLSHEKANNEGDETNHSGREKGVLSWGRQKGLRKDFPYGTDWIGRSLSPRSHTFTEGDLPHKKWAGKSVRQSRKAGSRPDTNEGANEQQIHSFGECDSKICRQTATEDPFPCYDEKDTEVEWVLERQAELIEQYEDEENAQRAWEEKYKEGKALTNLATEKVITPSNSGGMLDALTNAHSEEHGLMAKDEAAQIVQTEGNLPDHASHDSVAKNCSKVYPEETRKGNEEESLQSQSQNTPQDIDEPPVDTAACAQVNQGLVYLPVQELPSAEKNAECSETCGVKDPSHGQVSSSMDTELSKDLVLEPVVKAVRKSNLKRHLSSSFKFAVPPNDEPVFETSPEMHGFISCKQNGRHDKDISMELGESNGAKDASVLATADNHDAAYCVRTITSVKTHVSGRNSLPIVDDPSSNKDTRVVQEMLWQNIQARERQTSQSQAENNSTISSQNVNPPNRFFKDGESRQIEDLEAEQNIPGRRLSELPSYIESRGPGTGEYPKQHNYAKPLYKDYGFQLSKGLDGANLNNNDLYSGVGMKPGFHFQGLHAPPFEERALGSHRRPIDSFDRVADVLRVLEVAKLQVQSSNELDLPSSSDRSDNSRDAIYPEPPKLSSTYTNPSQSYAASGAYISRGPAPYSHNLNGWGALSSAHGAGLSRQVTSGPYIHYLSQMPKNPTVWPPPSSDIYNTNMYQYDFRQHR